ncbi:MAG: hypothetical protein BAJALOKI1v1_20035 [Promethearchaeota archaeon]|nr:MAG: hypothetical protein BAJALOKI1v1_20035 [Candidatus Lokiarchaeota archaeon]
MSVNKVVNVKREGKYLVFVDCFDTLSKTCSNYGWINNNLTLTDRVWKCTECSTTHEKNLNNSIILKKEGIRIFQEEKNLTMTTSKIGITEIKALRDNIRLQSLYSEVLEQLSMNREGLEQRRRLHGSYSFRKE